MKENLIAVPCTKMPVLSETNFELAAKPFIHCDRTVDFHVMIYLKSGKMEIIEENTTYCLLPHTLFFLKSGLHHYGITPCESGTTWYYAHFYCDLPAAHDTPYTRPVNREIYTHLSYDDCRKFYTLPKLLTLPEGNDIKTRFSQMIALHNSGDMLRSNTALSDILISCTEILDGRTSMDDPLIQTVLQFIENNFCRNFTGEEIAHYVGLSYKYMGLLFKQKTGMTIKEYQLMKRLQKAEMLLCTTNLSVSEISSQTGFYDQFYFSKVFRRQKGVSPTAYRNSYIPRI